MGRDFIITSLVTVLSRGVPVLVMPLLTNGFTLSEYGLIAIFFVLINLFSPIVIGNLAAGILREGLAFSHRGYKLLRLVSVYCVILLVIILCLWVLVDYELIYLFLMMLIVSAAHQDCLISLFRSHYKDYSFLFLSIFRAMSLVVPSIFVALNQLNLVGLMACYSISYVMISVAFTPMKVWQAKIDHGHIAVLRTVLKYCVFLIPYAAGQWVISSSSRAILGYALSEKEAGLFAIAYTLVSPIIFLFSVLGIVFSRLIFSEPDKWFQDDHNRHKILFWVVCAGFLCTLTSVAAIYFDYQTFQLINYYSRELVFLTGGISLSLLFHCMYSVYGNMLIYIKKTKSLAKNSIIVAVLHLIHNYFFVNTFGIIGSVYSVWISYFLIYILTFIDLKKLSTHPMNKSYMDILILSGGMFAQGILLLYFDSKWMNIYSG